MNNSKNLTLQHILVTGSAGFIGFHVCKELLALGNKVIGIDSLNDYYDVSLKKNRLKMLAENKNFIFKKHDISENNTKELLAEFNIGTIIHLAAQAGVRHSLEHPHDYIKNNINGFLNILEFARSSEIKPRVVYASTSSVYGGNRKQPFSEKDPVDHPLQFYAVTKRTNELNAHAYSYLFDINTIGLRFFTVYGPWGRPDMALFKFTNNILKNKPIEVFNNGKHIRDFTYIDDIVSGVISCAFVENNSLDSINKNNDFPNSSNSPFYIFNIGGNRPTKLLTFIKEIEKNLNKKAKILFLPMQPGDVADTKSDISSLNQLVGFEPKTSIKEGVKSFIDWYLDYYKIKN